MAVAFQEMGQKVTLKNLSEWENSLRRVGEEDIHVAPVKLR